MLLVCVLDETGSMRKNIDLNVQCFNYLRDNCALWLRPRRGEDPKDNMMCLATFNSEKGIQVRLDTPARMPRLEKALTHYKAKLEPAEGALAYAPAGGTNLFEAVLKTIRHVESSLPDLGEVVFVIQTDGEDNRSQATAKDVKQETQRLEALGWSFLFIGEGPMAEQTAEEMGIPKARRLSYKKPEDLKEAVKLVTQSFKRYRLSGEKKALEFKPEGET